MGDDGGLGSLFGGEELLEVGGCGGVGGGSVGGGWGIEGWCGGELEGETEDDEEEGGGGEGEGEAEEFFGESEFVVEGLAEAGVEVVGERRGGEGGEGLFDLFLRVGSHWEFSRESRGASFSRA